MTVRRWGWVGALALLTAVGAVGCDDETNDGIGIDNPIDDQNPPTPTAIDEAALTDAQAMRVAQLANAGEIAAAQIAQTRAQTQVVRDYAALMIADHTAANERLNGIAQRAGLTFEDSNLSRQLERDNALIADTLNRVADARFDLVYADSQVASHSKVAFMADALLVPNVQNAELIAELNALRGAVQTHLEEATQIQTAQTQQQ